MPKRSASALRPGLMSTPTMRVAPTRRAPWITFRPILPRPNTTTFEPGSNVVVFGLGGIGLNVIQGARLVGATRIVGVDINPGRKALAERFGMTASVNPKDSGRASWSEWA